MELTRKDIRLGVKLCHVRITTLHIRASRDYKFSTRKNIIEDSKLESVTENSGVQLREMVLALQ